MEGENQSQWIETKNLSTSKLKIVERLGFLIECITNENLRFTHRQLAKLKKELVTILTTKQ